VDGRKGGREAGSDRLSLTWHGNQEIRASFHIHLRPRSCRRLPLTGGESVGLDMPSLSLIGVEDGKGGFEGAMEEGKGEEVAFLETDGEGLLGLAGRGEGEELQRALREGGREGRREGGREGFSCDRMNRREREKIDRKGAKSISLNPGKRRKARRQGRK